MATNTNSRPWINVGGIVAILTAVLTTTWKLDKASEERTQQVQAELKTVGAEVRKELQAIGVKVQDLDARVQVVEARVSPDTSDRVVRLETIVEILQKKIDSN